MRTDTQLSFQVRRMVPLEVRTCVSTCVSTCVLFCYSIFCTNTCCTDGLLYVHILTITLNYSCLLEINLHSYKHSYTHEHPHAHTNTHTHTNRFIQDKWQDVSKDFFLRRKNLLERMLSHPLLLPLPHHILMMMKYLRMRLEVMQEQ